MNGRFASPLLHQDTTQKAQSHSRITYFAKLVVKSHDEMPNCNSAKKRFPPQPHFPSTWKNLMSFGIGGNVQWLAELSESEREKFDALRLDSNDRPAFRIIRNFARLVNDPEDDFKIVAEHLATRLGVTLQTACNIRLRFCDSGILEPTAAYVPHRFAARFRWIAHLEAQAALAL